MKIRSIHAEFESYMKACEYGKIHPSQTQELRRAFFAGAWIMICAFNEMPGTSESEVTAIMTAIENEARLFKERVGVDM